MNPYSATVEIFLLTSGGAIPLARVTPYSVEAREPEFYTGRADLVAYVDGVRFSRLVVVSGWRGRVGEIEGSEG